MKPSSPGLLFVGRFLITVSISLHMIGLFIFSVSSWFSLGSLYLSNGERGVLLLHLVRESLGLAHGSMGLSREI